MSPTPKHLSTYDRLLARERVNATPAPASGSSSGVTEIHWEGYTPKPGETKEVYVEDNTPSEKFTLGKAGKISVELIPHRRQISLPSKEACTHPRLTRTGRCFWCGVIVADLA